MPTYKKKKDYERFLFSLSYYQYANTPFKISRLLQIPAEEREHVLTNLEKAHDKAVDLICFCLMPNHFHLLLRQEKDGGISSFIMTFVTSKSSL